VGSPSQLSALSIAPRPAPTSPRNLRSRSAVERHNFTARLSTANPSARGYRQTHASWRTSTSNVTFVVEARHAPALYDGADRVELLIEGADCLPVRLLGHAPEPAVRGFSPRSTILGRLSAAAPLLGSTEDVRHIFKDVLREVPDAQEIPRLLKVQPEDVANGLSEAQVTVAQQHAWRLADCR